MDLEDLFTGGHRRKHGDHDSRPYRNKDRDRDHDRHDDDHDHDYDRARSSDDDDNHYRQPYREQHSGRGRHGGHDMLRTLTQLSGTVPHFKWIVAFLGIGLVLAVLVGGAVLIMLFPMIARALGFAYQNGVQGAVEAVIPPGGVKGAVESVVPATGLKGIVDSVVTFLQSIWFGKGA